MTKVEEVEKIFENFNKTSRLTWNISYVTSEPDEKLEPWHEDRYSYKESHFFADDSVSIISVPMFSNLEESDLHRMDYVETAWRCTLYIDKENQRYGLMTDI